MWANGSRRHHAGGRSHRKFFRPETSAGRSPDQLVIPDQVEDAIADIATVFHWSLESISTMSIHELAVWHGKALERYGVNDGQ
ncbi:MAG: GpE family phage tail protein [Rhodocyclaceae bacterium]